MANKTLFKSLIGKLIPATDAINEERAAAYALSPKHQLAQSAATGCLNTTFYAGADEQLAKVLELCADLDAEFRFERGSVPIQSGVVSSTNAHTREGCDTSSQTLGKDRSTSLASTGQSS